MRFLAGVVVVTASLMLAENNYVEDVQRWRKDHAERLQTDGGWLARSGFYWLKPGENTVGSAPSCQVRLPTGRAPQRLGTVTWKDGKLFFRAAGRLTANLNGIPDLRTAELITDIEGRPDVVRIPPDVLFFAVQQGSRVGIEVRDRQSEHRRTFTALQWYPIDSKWRVPAKFVAYEPSRSVSIQLDDGSVQQKRSPGYAEFTIAGKPLKLVAIEASDSLLFLFRDLTAGSQTHAHTRLLYASNPRRGEISLDFNKAENPFHMFVADAICLLPPPENQLGVAVEAGEMLYRPASTVSRH